MPTKVTINQTAFRDVIMEDGIVKSEAQMASYAINNFNYQKAQFLRDFENHEISKEITAGPGAYSSLFSWGSLFAFIGFPSERKPIDELTSFFKESFKPPPKVVGKGNKRKVRRINPQTAIYKTYGEKPTLKEIEAKTRWPWTDTGSWALDIEKGKFLHYSRYIFGHFEATHSRSGRGFQSKRGDVRDDYPSAPTNGYLKTMLDKFDDRF